MTTPLRNVPGIGPKTAEFLQQEGIDSAESLAAMDAEKLMRAPGFHLNRAQAVIRAAAKLTGGANKEGLVPVTVAGKVKKVKKSKGKKKGGKGKSDKKEKRGGKKDKKTAGKKDKAKKDKAKKAKGRKKDKKDGKGGKKKAGKSKGKK